MCGRLKLENNFLQMLQIYITIDFIDVVAICIGQRVLRRLRLFCHHNRSQKQDFSDGQRSFSWTHSPPPWTLSFAIFLHALLEKRKKHLKKKFFFLSYSIILGRKIIFSIETEKYPRHFKYFKRIFMDAFETINSYK